MVLDDIHVKVDRAKEHLNALNTEFDSFASKEPYALHVITYQRGNRIRDVEWLRDPPRRWGAIVGDCVHNLRSTLDHIIWQLSGGNGMAPNYAEFPVFVDERKYLRRTNKGNPAPGSGLKKIEGVTSRNARTAIRRLQPFRCSDPLRHPLWVLHELDRVDKHRAIHPLVGWCHTQPWRVGIEDLSSLPPGWRQVRATQSASYPTPTPTGQKVKVKMRFDLAMRVTVEAPVVGTEENIDVVLATLVDFVDGEVLPTFAPFL